MSSPRQIVLAALVSVLVVASLALLAWGPLSPDADTDTGDSDTEILARGVGLARETIYHSPQTPGYTAWTGAWTMPDDSLMVAFTQATGPVDPAARSQVSAELKRRVGFEDFPPERDFSGLRLSVKYLRSTDGGKSWKPAREDRYVAPIAQAYTPQPTIAPRDGTLIRRVNGYDIWSNPPIRRTAYLQRLDPGAKRWGPPQVLLDPRRRIYQISRMRRLKDGRIIALGAVGETPAGTPVPAAAQGTEAPT